MCLKTKKRILASGFAMQAMIFLIASNLERPIRIVNGNGLGAAVDETKLSEMLDQDLKYPPHNNDVLLDNVSGDLFEFNLI